MRLPSVRLREYLYLIRICMKSAGGGMCCISYMIPNSSSGGGVFCCLGFICDYIFPLKLHDSILKFKSPEFI
jgi:hypothetical protein